MDAAGRMSVFILSVLSLLSSVSSMPEPHPASTPPPPDGYPDMMGGPGHSYNMSDSMVYPGLGGPEGPEGPEGPWGQWGPGGLTEVTEAFCQMLMEAPVPPPANQVPWFCICSRCKGTLGPKGELGERGLPGSPGGPGRRGLTGFRGRPGFVGRQGIKGQKGDEGLKGDRGPVGSMGPKGGRGFKGDKGEYGLLGPPGDQGLKGDDGVCPDSCEAVQGPPGPPGLPGPAGPRGLLGLMGPAGAKGPGGDAGIAGATGAPGSKGQKGEVGPDGDCSCQDGAEGSPGVKGEKGDFGETGQMGPSGDKGQQGGKGDLGAIGMTGMPGPCMPMVQSSFSAGLSTSFPLPNAPVAFSQILSNRQGHYDPMGIYTAPVNGTYVFSYSLTVFERILKVGLFHNFLPVVKNTEPSELGTMSQQVVLWLARGDAVWLQVKDQTTNGMFAGGETSSIFSGFLLHPDTCDMLQLREPLFPMALFGAQYLWGDPEPTGPPTTTAFNA